MNLNNWQIIGISGIIVFLISLPFKVVQRTTFSGGSAYFLDIYMRIIRMFDITAITLSSFMNRLTEMSLSLIVIITLIFIIYSICYEQKYLYSLNSLIFSSLILYASMNSITNSVLYVGWGFYLMLSSGLFLIISNIFIFKNINVNNVSKKNIINNVYRKDVMLFIVSFWILFIINILLLIYFKMQGIIIA